MFSVRAVETVKRSARGTHEALAQAIDELAIGGWKIVEKTIDGFDDHSPLREAGDGAHCVQPRFELEGNSNTQLRVILDLLPFSCAGRRTSGFTSSVQAMIGHGRRSWRCTAEIRKLRRVSDSCVT